MSIIQAIFDAALAPGAKIPDRICMHPSTYFKMCMEPNARRVIVPPEGDGPATFCNTPIHTSRDYSPTGFAFEQRGKRVYTSDDWSE